MRSTIIPAQITTVEDKIAGNLGVTQLLLLTAPIFGGSALFLIFPPFFGYAVYKVVLIVCLAVVCAMLAIRFKGVILLRWAVILTGYMLRPHVYVFDKRSAYLRDIDVVPDTADVSEEVEKVALQPTLLPRLDPAALVKVQDFIAGPHAQLQFKTNRKGDLRAYVTEKQS
jgi:hypothetical protein